MSLRSNSLRRMRFSKSLDFSESISRWAFSISVVTSPIPRIRCAMRSGWNSSNCSGRSPSVTNLMGMPVTERIDNAAPPLASPSILVRMMPLMPIWRLNSPPEFNATCPVSASITSSVSQGLTASRMSASSRIRSSSMASLPAVSSISQWLPCFFAAATAFLATFTASVLRGSSL